MLKSIFVAGLAGMMLVTAVKAQQPSTPIVHVHKGILLKLATMQALDPNIAKAGDDVPLLLERPLYVEGVTLLPAGEILHGTVTKVKKAGSKCKSGEIKWKVEQITFHDGTTVKTKVMAKSASSKYSVPLEVIKLPAAPGDRAGEVIEGALATPFIAIYLADAAIKKPFNRGSCPNYTQDRPLPANATIALEIVEDRAVRY